MGEYIFFTAGGVALAALWLFRRWYDWWPAFARTPRAQPGANGNHLLCDRTDLVQLVGEQLGSRDDIDAIRSRVFLGAMCHQARAIMSELRVHRAAEYSAPRLLLFEEVSRAGDLRLHRAYDTTIRRAVTRRSMPMASVDRTAFARERAVFGLVAIHNGHRFLAHLVQEYDDPTTLYMTTAPFVRPHLTLVDRVADILPETHVRFYAAELAVAVDHLHTIGVLHRSVAPESVLIGADGHLVLGGIACAVVRDAYTLRNGSLTGIPEFIAPEMLLRAPYNGKIDVRAARRTAAAAAPPRTKRIHDGIDERAHRS